MIVIGVFLLFFGCASAREITDEEYHQFPPLFHLDDYDRCLTQRDGLYCHGTFKLQPTREPNLRFEMMKEYSKKNYAFNHTLLHRGYCVSERCPECLAKSNVTLCFEQCVNKQVDSTLTASLHTAYYCTTPQEQKAKAVQEMDSLQYAFLLITFLIIFLNAVGTVYDVFSTNRDPFPQLRYWSVRSNFNKLCNPATDKDPNFKDLSAIHGYRAMSGIIVLAIHVIYGRCTQYALSNQMEKIAGGKVIEFVKVGSSLLHTYVMITCFLIGYSLLVYSKEHRLSFRLLPLCILKRVIRVSPLYLFMVGYAATWWPRHGDGPLWSLRVERKSAICRNTFWQHAFYVNNIDFKEPCLESLWFLAADMHITILVCALTIWLARLGRRALIVYAALFVIACTLTIVVAYWAGWSWSYTMSPESVRVFVANDPSLLHVYTSSWILLPACFIGLFGAHLYFELQKQMIDLSQCKWLFMTAFYSFFAYLFGSVFLIKNYNDILPASLIIGLHRPIFVLITGIALFMSFYVKDSIVTDVFSWKGWQIPSRLSLPVFLVHFVLLTSFAASKTHTVATTWFNVMEDWIVLSIISYAIAVPMAVLIEIPAQRTLGAMIFGIKQKQN